ncbi:PAS domain S-box protein [bacterium]|nr:PAS domain S-box protein [bacterium]
MPSRSGRPNRTPGGSAPGGRSQDNSHHRIAQLETELAQSQEQRDTLARNYYSLLSAINMPGVSVDSQWRLTGYWGNFSTLREWVSELAAKKAPLSELLQDGDFQKIEAHFSQIEALAGLPFDRNDEPWVVEYEGPDDKERIGRDWRVSRSCDPSHWRLVRRDGRMELEHRFHPESEADCYLMLDRSLNRPDRDIKVIYRIHTGHAHNRMRDFSLVIGGALGNEEMLCDSLGYTVCVASLYNTQTRIQRQATDLVLRHEVLASDRDYEIVVERTGGRIRRWMTDLKTGRKMPLLETIDSDAVYDRSPYLGFTTFAGQARFFGIRVLTRKSLFRVNRFRIPFEVEVGLKGMNGRRFKLRMGREVHDGLRWTLMFEDITEQKRSAEKIRFSEEKYRALFEMESDALFLISNVDGRILEVNQAAVEMYGYSRSELLRLRNLDLSGEPDQTHAATLSRLTVIPVRWHRRKDGAVFPVEINARHFTWQGLPVHLAAIRGIEERIRSHKVQEEQHQFLRQVIDMNPSMIYVLDEEGRNILANETFRHFLGVGPEEITGKYSDEFFLDREDGLNSRQADRELLEGSKDKHVLEQNVRDRKGQLHRLYTVKIAERNAAGKVCRIFGVSTDITAIRQSEEALRRSEKRFRELFEHSNDAVFIHDLEGRTLDVNRQACRMLGYTRAELLDRHVVSLHPEADRESGQRHLQGIGLQGGISIESRLLRADGSRIEVEISSKLIDLETRTVQSVIRDITARKRGEAALRDSERKYRVLFDTSSEALSIIDVETGRYIEVNRAGQELFGYTRKEFLEDIKPQDLNPEPEQSLQHMKDIIASDKVHRFEMIHLHKNKTRIPVEIYAAPFSLDGHRYILAQARDITERKRAEEALRERERRYRALFDTSSEALCVFDLKDQTFIEANRAALELYGYSREEFIGLTPYAMTHDPELTEKNFERLLKDCEFHLQEITNFRKDGSSVPVEVFGTLFQLEGRNMIMIQVRDITERKKAQRLLLESEARSRAMLEAIPDLMFRLDRQGMFLDYKGHKDWLYLQPDQFLGKSISEVMPGHIAETLMRKIEQTLQSGLMEWFEYELAMPDGMHFYECRMVAIDPTQVLALVRDITERHIAAAQLAQAHSELDQIFNATNPIAVIGADKSVLRVNRSWIEVFGQRIEDLVGQQCCDLWSGTRCNTANCPLEKIRSGLDKYELEIEKRLLDGSKLPCILTVTPFRDPEGKLLGIVESFKDISELKLLEQERLRSDKLESIGLLAGGIAHDFNNILTSILGNASLARMMVKPEDSVTEPLSAIENSSLRARELTMQLLTFSRGGQPVKRIASLADLVQEAVKFALSGSSVSYELKFQPQLWAVEVDPGQINQVLNNLIINADQAMPKGGTIRISLDNCRLRKNQVPGLEAGRYVRMSLSDSGIGIAPELMPRIFDPYFTTKQKGSGLGLATVYSIVKRHGGVIVVESELQKGTTFKLWFPASSQKQTALEEKSAVRAGRGESILVMDDEAAVRKVLQGMLEKLGYRVEQAADGDAAVELFIQRLAQGKPFDAVIMDLTIPGGMGGREAVQKLLEIDPQVKAIVSSGYSNEQVLSDFRKYGFSGIMTKPYRLEELKAVMNRVLYEP